MTISDRTRKILLGRSGNRCAICKCELLVNATPLDMESVTGDECHIVSAQENGPRYDPSYPQGELDLNENLILLCRIHHKMVDDQEKTYTTTILRQLKVNHEIWVSEKLTDRLRPFRLRRIKEKIPEFLSRLITGKEILDVVIGSCAYSSNHDELKSQAEVDLIGSFLQDIHDWGEIGDDLEPKDRVIAAYGLTESLHELEAAGFYVFGGREIQLLKGGIQSEEFCWPVAIINVLRSDNSQIIHLDDLVETAIAKKKESGHE
jgi:hypothetical protein